MNDHLDEILKNSFKKDMELERKNSKKPDFVYRDCSQDNIKEDLDKHKDPILSRKVT